MSYGLLLIHLNLKLPKTKTHSSDISCDLFLYNFYLFLFGWAGSLLLCRLFSSCSERGLLSSCCKWGLLFVEVCGLLTEVTPLIVEHGLQAMGFSSCGM